MNMYVATANNYLYFAYAKNGISGTWGRNLIYKASLTQAAIIDWQLYNCILAPTGYALSYSWAVTGGTDPTNTSPT